MSLEDVAKGLKILIVEDELLIAMSIEDTLLDGGYEVVGPFSSAHPAMQRIEEEAPAAALLDVNIKGGDSFSIADLLVEKDRPFLFLTGYDKGSVPERFHDRRCLLKPVLPSDLIAEVVQLTNGIRTGEEN